MSEDDAHKRISAIMEHLRLEHSLSAEGCDAMQALQWILLNAYDGVVKLGPPNPKESL